MRLLSIASGSSGNSIYVGSNNTHILVDVGISAKRIECGLKELELKGADIDAIFITHEHSDHIQGLGVISRKYGIPIYATAGTIDAVKRISALGKIDESLYNVVHYNEDYCIGDITISTIETSHDASEPVAYSFSENGKKAAVITDLGYYNDYIVEKLQNLDAIYLEANHDVRMLQLGRYPYMLKQRILGNKGHLSNETSGHLLNEILHDNMKKIILSHLSQENNLPELAYEAVRLEVTMADNKYNGDDFDISVARRGEPSEILCI